MVFLVFDCFWSRRLDSQASGSLVETFADLLTAKRDFLTSHDDSDDANTTFSHTIRLEKEHFSPFSTLWHWRPGGPPWRPLGATLTRSDQAGGESEKVVFLPPKSGNYHSLIVLALRALIPQEPHTGKVYPMT